MSASPEYVIVGHVTKDLAPNGGFRIGGTATYSALSAERLGLRVGVLTSAEPTLPLFADAPSIVVRRKPARCTTTFENSYVAGHRHQRIRAVAQPLTRADLPAEWDPAAIVHLGPVAQEVDPALAEAFSGMFLGVTPQGWLRGWDARGCVFAVEWEAAERVLGLADAVVLSQEDLGGAIDRLERYVRLARIVVLTVGKEGAIVYCRGREQRVPAYRVAERHPTGAGDVFATAYFVRLYETGDAIEAARYGNCAASFVVEATGGVNPPSREQIVWRLSHGRVRGWGR